MVASHKKDLVLGKNAKTDRSPMNRGFLTWLRNTFLAGLAFAIPLVVTLWIIGLIYFAIRKVSQPIVTALRLFINQLMGENLISEPPSFVYNTLGFILVLVFLFGLGIMARNVLGNRVLSTIDRLLLNIPGIGFIYSGLKQIIESFRHFGITHKYENVVYIEYPSPGCRLIGFVTSEYHDAQMDRDVTAVFIPTAPNPMTGFVIIVDTDKVINADITLEHATKMVLSAGLIGDPFYISKENPPPAEES